MKEYIKIEELEGDQVRIHGQLIIEDPSRKSNPNDIIGIASEDIKKGQIVKIKL